MTASSPTSPRGTSFPLSVDDAQLHGTHRPADGAVDLLRIVAKARIGLKAGLQHAVELDQMALHALLVLADRLDRRRGATGDDDAQGGDVEASRRRVR